MFTLIRCCCPFRTYHNVDWKIFILPATADTFVFPANRLISSESFFSAAEVLVPANETALYRLVEYFFRGGSFSYIP